MEEARVNLEAKEKAEAVAREEKAARINAEACKLAEEQMLQICREEDQLRAAAELLAVQHFKEKAEGEVRARSKALIEAEQSCREFEQALKQSEALVRHQESALLVANEEVRSAQARARDEQQARLTAQAVQAAELAEILADQEPGEQIQEQQAHIEELQAMLKFATAQVGAEEVAVVVDALLKSRGKPDTPSPLDNGYTSPTPQDNELSMTPEQLHSPSSAGPSRTSPSRFLLMKKARFYAQPLN